MLKPTRERVRASGTIRRTRYSTPDVSALDVEFAHSGGYGVMTVPNFAVCEGGSGQTPPWLRMTSWSLAEYTFTPLLAAGAAGAVTFGYTK
jgi:hypothetical protein